jgi:hypothetical protein
MYKNENEITTLSEYFQNPVHNFVERGKIDATNRQTHDRSLSWLGTVTYIKNGGVKRVFFALFVKLKKNKCINHVLTCWHRTKTASI